MGSPEPGSDCTATHNECAPIVSVRAQTSDPAETGFQNLYRDNSPDLDSEANKGWDDNLMFQQQYEDIIPFTMNNADQNLTKSERTHLLYFNSQNTGHSQFISM